MKIEYLEHEEVRKFKTFGKKIYQIKVDVIESEYLRLHRYMVIYKEKWYLRLFNKVFKGGKE